MARRGRPPGRTARGDATREALYQSAIRRFAEDGFEASSVRAIAKDAGVTGAAMYRHFPSKQSVVIELYRRLSLQFEAHTVLPEGSWSARFSVALNGSLETLKPHRATLRSVLGELLVGEASLLQSVESRDRVRNVFVEAVVGAGDAPRRAEVVGRLAYVLHLGFVLLWCVDRSEGQEATGRARVFLTRLPLGWILRVPGVQRGLERLESILDRALFS